jgi:hypothetical protein
VSIIEEHYGVEEPLIWTSRGNLPISTLEYKYWWEQNDKEIFFHEQYLLDGEEVKHSAHGYLFAPMVDVKCEVGEFK